MHELMELEEQGWHALSTAGDAAETFYGNVLRDDAVMLFPGGMRLEGKERILQSFAARPWETFRIEDAQVIRLTAGAATVAYKVTAQRKGSAPYVALVSSTYVRDESWLLVVHQQTPA